MKTEEYRVIEEMLTIWGLRLLGLLLFTVTLMNVDQTQRIENLERERTETRVVEGRDVEESQDPDRQDD